MFLESSITQQTSQFAESLNVRPAPSVEKSVDEQGQEAKVPVQGGDTVSISEEARALIAAEESGDSAGTAENEDQNQQIQQLQEQIEKLEAEIKALQESNLPEKEKLSQVSEKQIQLMELNDQLLKAQQEDLKMQGLSSGGGTRARGAGNSVADF